MRQHRINGDRFLSVKIAFWFVWLLREGITFDGLSKKLCCLTRFLWNAFPEQYRLLRSPQRPVKLMWRRVKRFCRDSWHLCHQRGAIIRLDVYIISLTVLLFSGLFFFPQWQLLYILAFFRLTEVTVVMLYDIFPSHWDVHGRPIKVVSGRVREKFLTLFAVSNVVLSAAIVFHAHPEVFGTSKLSPLTALYKSAQVITTIGPGEIDLASRGAQLVQAVVLWELALFVLIFLIRLPIAINSVQVKESDDDLRPWRP